MMGETMGIARVKGNRVKKMAVAKNFGKCEKQDHATAD